MKVTLKAVSGWAGTVIAALSALLIIVDGVAIIFTYASLVFALFAIGVKNKRVLKVYGVVFILAHLVFGWRMYSDINSSGNDYSNVSPSTAPPNSRNFEPCHHKMSQHFGTSPIELTPEDTAGFGGRKCNEHESTDGHHCYDSHGDRCKK